MKDFIKTNFQFLVIIGLAVFFFLQRTTQPAPQPQQPIVIVTSDTTNKQHTGTVTNTSKEIQYIPYKVETVREVMGDTAAIRRVIEDYYSTRVQKSELPIPDSLGHVSATTYTTKNNVDSTKWDYKINERTITNTITIREPYKPKGQLYWGGGLGASTTYKISDIHLGIGYKNKKDQLFTLEPHYNPLITLPQDRLSVQASSYWKIHFGKK